MTKDGWGYEEEEKEAGTELETDSGAASCPEDREIQVQDWGLLTRADAYVLRTGSS